MMIFLGAGASAPFGINTSKVLTKHTKELLDEKYPALFSNIETFYLESVRVELDFVMILTQLAALTNEANVDPGHQSLIFARQNPEHIKDYSDVIAARALVDF